MQAPPNITFVNKLIDKNSNGIGAIKCSINCPRNICTQNVSLYGSTYFYYGTTVYNSYNLLFDNQTSQMYSYLPFEKLAYMNIQSVIEIRKKNDLKE